jgi:hypothetical protein
MIRKKLMGCKVKIPEDFFYYPEFNFKKILKHLSKLDLFLLLLIRWIKIMVLKEVF